MQYYDEKNKKLIFLKQKANPEYWDDFWDKHNLSKIKKSKILYRSPKIRAIIKYLPKGSRILEGGCGIGTKAYYLHKIGYECIGVDYAAETVKKVNEKFKELKVILGDVRCLQFPDSYFDGYLSFGVIEHFYVGYNDIAREMFRVLKPNGILLVSFPYMSPLRKIKAKRGKYPIWDEKKYGLNDFYQFALDMNEVKTKFEEMGFSLLEKKSETGLLGFINEVSIFSKHMKKMYDARSLFGRVVRRIINSIFSKFSGHSIYMVFRKIGAKT